MLTCTICGRVNPDDIEECIECGGSAFRELDLVPEWLKEWEKEQDKMEE